MPNATTPRLVPAGDLLFEDAADVVALDALHPDPLRPAAVARNDLDGGGLHPERLGDQVDHGLVGPAAGGGRGDLHLHRVAVPAGDLGAPGTGLYVQADDHIAVAGNIE